MILNGCQHLSRHQTHDKREIHKRLTSAAPLIGTFLAVFIPQVLGPCCCFILAIYKSMVFAEPGQSDLSGALRACLEFRVYQLCKVRCQLKAIDRKAVSALDWIKNLKWIPTFPDSRFHVVNGPTV